MADTDGGAKMRVAILPAAGKGGRMGGGVPKQLLPLASGQRVIDYALSAAVLADCWPHIIVPRGDEEIARYVKRGSFSYAVGDGDKPLADIAALRPVYEGAEILYVMPDTVFNPMGGAELLELLDRCDVALACFNTDELHRFGMCEVNHWGICNIVDKPNYSFTGLAWGMIAWKRHYFWDSIEAVIDSQTMSDALNQRLRTHAPIRWIGLNSYTDIGTPEDYERALEEGW